MAAMTSLVLTISRDDAYLHVGTTGELAAHARIQHNDDEQATDRVVEFFRSDGTPLRPLLDPTLTIVGFDPDDSAMADPSRLRGRIDAVMARARERLREDPAAAGGFGEPEIELPPASEGLDETMVALAAMCGLGGHGEHNAGWFHNLMHRL